MEIDGLALENVEDVYPLSATQAGMLFHSIASPGSGVYVGQTVLTLRGPLNVGVWQAAWDKVLVRHSALRSVFVWEGLDDPLQVVRERVSLPWLKLDWSHLSDEQRETALRNHLDELKRTGFDLARSPLMSMSMVAVNAERHVFIWTCHHLILDDWSAQVVLDEVVRLYSALCKDAPLSLADPFAFRDYIDWLERADQSASESFWRDYLAGFISPSRLSTTADPTIEDHRELHDFRNGTIDAETVALLEETARSCRVTLNTLLQAAWAILLGRYCDQDDVVFGMTSAIRPAELSGVERAVGLFIATLPVRCRIESFESIRSFLQSLEQDGLSIREFDRTPLTRLHELSDLSPGAALFESLIVLEQKPGTIQFGSEDLYVEDIEASDQSNYPIALLVTPDSDLALKLVFDPAVIAPERAEGLLRHFQTVLKALPAHLDRPPCSVSLLTPAEEKQCLAASQGPQRDLGPFISVHDQISTHARSSPDRIAIRFGEAALSYRDLEKRANQWAASIRQNGAKPGDRIAIFMDRGPDLIAAFIGTLKSGCTYIPLDPTYRAQRLFHMLSDSEATLLLLERAYADDFGDDAPPHLFSDDVGAIEQNQFENDAQQRTVSPDDTAYILYTSGTTGSPKGVLVSHGGLAHSTQARDVFYERRPEAFLLLSSPAFDSSVVGIYWTLCTGGTLVLPTSGQETDMPALASCIADAGVTHSLCLPSLYETLLEYASWDSLRTLDTVIVAGEECPSTLVDRHREALPSTRLVNEYGPTEATVWCTAFDATDHTSAHSVPIGRPIANSRIYLLDRCGHVVPTNVPGEIYVGGPGIAAGYVGRPQETADRFITDPYSDDTSQRLYRTGDLAVRNAEGLLHYLGRSDRQVKIRGHRIELAEIERVLCEHHHVDQAVVDVVRRAHEQRLVAYLVVSQTERVDRDDMANFVRRQLPEVMRPSVFVQIDSVPLTANGKLDRNALPPVDVDRGSGRDFVAPRTPVEQELAALWKRILWLEHDVGVNDNFFDLGGHSLLSIRLVNEIEATFNVRLPVSILYRIGTIAELAEELESTGPTASAPAAMDVPEDRNNDLDEDSRRALIAYTAGWKAQRARPDSLLFKLNEDGSKPPLFWCFQGFTEFRQLAKYLGPDQPVYGMRSAHLILEYTRENYRRLAAHYVDEIVQVDPDGPYYIGGNCQAAWIAIEMAKLLQAREKTVALLCMMEQAPPFPYQGRVALLFGQLSDEDNPFRKYARPEIGWRRFYSNVSFDIIRGGHGVFFKEPNVQDLAEKLNARLAEARFGGLTPLPDCGYRASWSIESPITTIDAGQSTKVSVGLRNDSPIIWARSDLSGLYVVNRWRNRHGELLIGQDADAVISYALEPGQTASLTLSVTAPATPGVYRLEIDVSEEGVTWFSERGVSPATMDVEVVLGTKPSSPAKRLGPQRDEAGEDAPSELLESREKALESRIADGHEALKRGNFDVAARELDAAAASTADLFVDLGYCRFHLGEFEKSIESFKAALALSSTSQEALFGLAQALEAKGQNGSASRHYKKALAVSHSEEIEFAYRRLRRNRNPLWKLSPRFVKRQWNKFWPL